MQDTGEVSPVTGALAFTVVFGAAGVPPFGWTFVMPAVGAEGVGVVAEPVFPLLEDAVTEKFAVAVPPID